MGLLTLTQIPCHHVLANEFFLNLKYCIGLKHFFNINLGIGIIKKTTFLFVYSIYRLVFYSNLDQESSLDADLNFASNEYPLGILLMCPATPKTRNTWKKRDDGNLSKNTGRYVENTNKKAVFFYDTYPQIYIKKVFKNYTVFQI